MAHCGHLERGAADEQLTRVTHSSCKLVKGHPQVHTHKYTHTSTHTQVHTYKYTHTHTQVHTHKYTHTNTHTQVQTHKHTQRGVRATDELLSLIQGGASLCKATHKRHSTKSKLTKHRRKYFNSNQSVALPICQRMQC